MSPDQGPPGPTPGHGAPPGYGLPPGYGPPPGWGYGYAVPVWQPPPGRPGVVTAAGVLGFVTGGLTVLVSLAFVVVTSSGEGDPSTGVLSAGLPCGIAMLAGAGMLLGRRRLPVLALACVATLVVLVTVWSVVLAGPDGDDPDARIGITISLLLGAVLPTVTLVFSLLGTVRRWLAGD